MGPICVPKSSPIQTSCTLSPTFQASVPGVLIENPEAVHKDKSRGIPQLQGDERLAHAHVKTQPADDNSQTIVTQHQPVIFVLLTLAFQKS